MNERDLAMKFIERGAINMLYIKNNSNIDRRKCFELWQKTKKYRPKFFPISEMSGASLQRSEYFVTDDYIEIILSILKLIYALLETSSYTNLAISQTCLKISAMQMGRGMFDIMVKSVDRNRHVEVWVQTTTNR